MGKRRLSAKTFLRNYGLCFQSPSQRQEGTADHKLLTVCDAFVRRSFGNNLIVSIDGQIHKSLKMSLSLKELASLLRYVAEIEREHFTCCDGL